MDNYVLTLQTKLTGLLNDCIRLLNDSDTVLYRTFTFPNVIKITQNIDPRENVTEIERKIQDVQALQIRMPIVAPMKAGKSTIINAMIGNEFLPTRTDAMTALPTAVVLKLGELNSKDASAPQLILEDETLKALEHLQSSVTNILKNNILNDQELDNRLHANPHLLKTAKSLRDDPKINLNVQNKLEDNKQVQNMLTFINELVRISFYLSSYQSNSELSLDAFLKNIPFINVNYQPVSNTQSNATQRCQLLVIDTPGPNEASGIAHLTRFVTNELQKADVILVVVEYSHLNTQSDAKIIHEIKKIRHMKKNQECIYVLISKADLRRREDMSKCELREHVASLYNVSVNHVFEISGKHALIAQKFLADYKKHGDSIDVANSDTVKDVLEVCPFWQILLQKCTPQQVEQYANCLKITSGLDNVLDSVLKTVLGEVVRRCIQSATEICQRTSKNLINEVDIRLNGLQLMAAKLHQEIKDLSLDLNDLTEIREKQLDAMQEIICELKNDLTAIFENISNEYSIQVEQIFDKNNKKWYTEAEEYHKENFAKIELGATVGATALGGYAAMHVMDGAGQEVKIGYSAIVGAVLGWALTQKLFNFFRSDENEIQFKNEEEAKIFTDDITEMTNKLSKNAYATIKKDVTEVCSRSCDSFYSQITKQMINMLDRANHRLNSTFNITHVTPIEFKLNSEEIQVEIGDIGRQEKNLSSLLRGMLSGNRADCDSTWILSRSLIQNKCVESVKANLTRLQTDIIENTNNQMTKNLMSVCHDLQDYLLKYQGYCEICLSDKKLTDENQTLFKEQLQALKERLIGKQQEVADFHESVDWEKLA